MTVSDMGGPEEATGETPSDPHHEHERILQELHRCIWAKLHNGSQAEVIAVRQPYHPAYVAAKILMLETMLGVLAGLVVGAKLIGEQQLLDMIGETYIHDIEELRLKSSVVHAASFLGEHAGPYVGPDIQGG